MKSIAEDSLYAINHFPNKDKDKGNLLRSKINTTQTHNYVYTSYTSYSFFKLINSLSGNTYQTS